MIDTDVRAYNVLVYTLNRFQNGGWVDGYRNHPTGRQCLLGAIDTAIEWHPDEVRARVIELIVAELPPVPQFIARLFPQTAIAMFNDFAGEQEVIDLLTDICDSIMPHPVDVREQATVLV